jgi:hypothetical protein
MAARINHFRPMPLDTALERDGTCFTNKVPRPLLAQMRNADRVQKCLLFGVDRTDRRQILNDASDPFRKSWLARRLVYSMTSSAASVFGTVRPSAFAVLRLTANSNNAGCSIGSSPGFAPRRIRAT